MVLDLVVQWPASAGPIDGLLRRSNLPLARRPLHVDPDDAHVWVAFNGALAARLRSRGLRSRKRVRLLGGRTVEPGYELQIVPDSIHILARPAPLSTIPGAGSRPFGHPTGIRYLARRPRRFVRITKRSSKAAPQEIDLEITSTHAWLQQTRDQAHMTTEGLKHATEAALVQRFRTWRFEQQGEPFLVRHVLTTESEAELLSDAYDKHLNLLIEAKGRVDRPSVRMAIGQLLDYRRLMDPVPRVAMLLPQMPPDEMIDLARSVGIGVIWETPNGGFADSESGRLVS